MITLPEIRALQDVHRTLYDQSRALSRVIGAGLAELYPPSEALVDMIRAVNIDSIRAYRESLNRKGVQCSLMEARDALEVYWSGKDIQ